MDRFENVTVLKKANIYFNGNVTSRTVILTTGEKKTLGVMLPGEYEFNTADKEIMEIISGELDVMLPGNTDWLRIIGGQSFEVPAESKFQLKVYEIADYICSFVK